MRKRSHQQSDVVPRPPPLIESVYMSVLLRAIGLQPAAAVHCVEVKTARLEGVPRDLRGKDVSVHFVCGSASAATAAPSRLYFADKNTPLEAKLRLEVRRRSALAPDATTEGKGPGCVTTPPPTSAGGRVHAGAQSALSSRAHSLGEPRQASGE